MSIGTRIAAAGGALATLALLGGTAQAQDVYVKGFGGWTIPQNNSFQLNERDTGASVSSGLDFDSGYALGAAVGYDFSPSLALEGEYVYRNADASFKNVGSNNGETKSNAFMVNALYKFQPLGAQGQFHPYAGAGIGVADLQVKNDGEKLDSDYNFAYQAIAGVSYDVAPQWSLYSEARYFAISSSTVENDDFSYKRGYDTVDWLFGASYRF